MMLNFVLVVVYKSLLDYCCLLSDKKVLKKYGLKAWCKKIFGYRVIHHGWNLMSCL